MLLSYLGTKAWCQLIKGGRWRGWPRGTHSSSTAETWVQHCKWISVGNMKAPLVSPFLILCNNRISQMEIIIIICSSQPLFKSNTSGFPPVSHSVIKTSLLRLHNAFLPNTYTLERRVLWRLCEHLVLPLQSLMVTQCMQASGHDFISSDCINLLPPGALHTCWTTSPITLSQHR